MGSRTPAPAGRLHAAAAAVRVTPDPGTRRELAALPAAPPTWPRPPAAVARQSLHAGGSELPSVAFPSSRRFSPLPRPLRLPLLLGLLRVLLAVPQERWCRRHAGGKGGRFPRC